MLMQVLNLHLCECRFAWCVWLEQYNYIVPPVMCKVTSSIHCACLILSLLVSTCNKSLLVDYPFSTFKSSISIVLVNDPWCHGT